MNELLGRCNWPELAEKYDTALRDAVEFIPERYTVSGIIVSGTIIRGAPDPASDLDIYVIHQQPFRQRLQKFFNQVPAEIFVNPPSAVERYFVEEQASRRPLTAHMLATGFVILNLDPVIDELRQKAASLLTQPPAAPDDLTMPHRQGKWSEIKKREKREAWRQHIVALSSRHREEGERDTAPRLFLSGPVLAPEKKPRILRKKGPGARPHCAIAQFFL